MKQLTKNPYNPDGPDPIRYELWQLGYKVADGELPKPDLFHSEEYMEGRNAGLRDLNMLDQGYWKVSLSHPDSQDWCVKTVTSQVALKVGWRVGPWFESKHEAAALAYNISKSMREQRVPLLPAATIPHAELLMTLIEMEIDIAWDAFRDDPYEQFDPSVLDSIEMNPDLSVDLTYDQATEVASLLPSWMDGIEDCTIEEDPKDVVRFALILQHNGFPFEVDILSSYNLTLDNSGFFHYTFPDGTGGVSTSYRFASTTLHNHFRREYRKEHPPVVVRA